MDHFEEKGHKPKISMGIRKNKKENWFDQKEQEMWKTFYFDRKTNKTRCLCGRIRYVLRMGGGFVTPRRD